MAVKTFATDIDLLLVGQLINGRTQNLTTSARGTLAGTLTSAHIGLHVWDTDLSQFFYWNGSAFISGVPTIAGAMTYKGTITSLSVGPSSPVAGDTYVFTGTAGTLTWASQTFNPNATISPNDLLVYRGTNIWDTIQGDEDYATNSTVGNIRLGTTSEVNAGVDTTVAVVPSTLQGFATNRAFGKVYFLSSASLVANTPLTVNHALALQNRDAFVISVKDSTSSEISVDVDSTDANNLTVTSSVALSGVKICVVGF